MFKRLLILISLLSLAACNSTITRQAVRGDNQQLVASAKKQDLNQLSVQEHYYVCQSLLRVREFKSFFSCHKKLSQRVAAADGYMEYENNSAMVLSVRKMFYNRPQSEFRLKTLLAEAYLALGQYDEVIQYAGRAVELADKNIFQLKHEQEAGSASKAFVSIFTLGQDGEVKKEQTQAWSIPARGYLGLAYVAKGNWTRAKAIAEQITAINTGTLNTRQYDITRRAAAARIYFAAKQYDKALTVMNQDTDVGLGGLLIDTVSVANIINPANYLVASASYGAVSIEDINYIYHFESRFMLYRSLLETGHLKEAKQGYDKSLAEPRLKGFGQMHYLVLYDRGRIALHEAKADEAAGYFKRAIEVIEAQRSSINIERFKIGFVGDKQEIYQQLIAVLGEQGKDAEAFNYAERAKARALVDMLAYRKTFKVHGQSVNSHALLTKLDKLERQGNARAIKNTRENIRRRNPELASLVTVSSLKAKNIQSLLKQDEALLEYYYQNEKALYVFLLTPRVIKVIKLDANGLKEKVGRLRAAVEQAKPVWKKYSAQLYQQLVAPLAEDISSFKRLTIVPHGVLHYLPFNVLGKNQYLIKKYRLRLLPSASVIRFLAKPVATQNELLVLGNPDLNNPRMDLPGAEDEARAIARYWSKSKVVLRKQASETQLKQQANQFRYIHMASHGQFNPQAPEKSRLLLAPDTKNDGSLTTTEVYDLDLNAALVSLSACQTGLGDVRQGDDVIGLNRGFLYAGAQTVVSSLWSVPDESTRVLMTAFYKNLKKLGKAEALRQAQIVTMKKYPRPNQWAAFQMTGGW